MEDTKSPALGKEQRLKYLKGGFVGLVFVLLICTIISSGLHGRKSSGPVPTPPAAPVTVAIEGEKGVSSSQAAVPSPASPGGEPAVPSEGRQVVPSTSGAATKRAANTLSADIRDNGSLILQGRYLERARNEGPPIPKAHLIDNEVRYVDDPKKGDAGVVKDFYVDHEGN